MENKVTKKPIQIKQLLEIHKAAILPKKIGKSVEISQNSMEND
jgi:hypothetical protein